MIPCTAKCPLSVPIVTVGGTNRIRNEKRYAVMESDYVRTYYKYNITYKYVRDTNDAEFDKLKNHESILSI
jgi:hypothetical protein